MGTINNWVSKVVNTVSAPFSAPSPKSKKKAKTVKCKHTGKCKCN